MVESPWGWDMPGVLVGWTVCMLDYGRPYDADVNAGPMDEYHVFGHMAMKNRLECR